MINLKTDNGDLTDSKAGLTINLKIELSATEAFSKYSRPHNRQLLFSINLRDLMSKNISICTYLAR